jgi:hypothetical protein
MSSFRQIEANRRNARLSTGPTTEEGKKRSRQNAVRHGLTAETVIGSLEDAEDYAAFEMAVTAGYDAQTAVERELVLRLASLLWRLRRATAIETGLFELHAQHLLQFRKRRNTLRDHQKVVGSLYQDAVGTRNDTRLDPNEPLSILDLDSTAAAEPPDNASDDLTRTFVCLTNLSSYPLDRLSRYEATLWRQACQIMFTLQCLDRRKPWERRRLR